MMADTAAGWYAAVDWGSEQHQACLLDAAGAVVGERSFRHDGAGLTTLCDWLVSVAGDARALAVAIEVPHGPVVDALLDRGFAVYAINPKQPIPSSSSGCATASASPGPRTTGAMPESQRPGCARTRTCSGPSRPATRL